jgi:hypothetical protein
MSIFRRLQHLPGPPGWHRCWATCRRSSRRAFTHRKPVASQLPLQALKDTVGGQAHLHAFRRRAAHLPGRFLALLNHFDIE